MPLDFLDRRGNNFAYSFPFWKLRYADHHDPVLPPGLYRYHFRFSVDQGATWFEAGQGRRFVIAPDQDCSLFPDHAPESCLMQRAVGWAGDWGSFTTGSCGYRAALVDPITLLKSSAGVDCMLISADVYVAGLTDQDGDPGALLAQVETDLGLGGGALAQMVTYPLSFRGRVGNKLPRMAASGRQPEQATCPGCRPQDG